MVEPTEKAVSGISRQAARIGNPLEWCFVDRALLMIGAYLFLLWVMAIIVGLGGVSEGTVDLDHPLGVSAIHQTTALICLAAGTLMAVLFALGLGLRRRRPQARWPAYVMAVFLPVFSAWWLTWLGHTTNPASFLIIFVHVFIGMLLYDRTFCWLIVASWLVSLGGWMIVERIGLIPYAPFTHQLAGMKVTVVPMWLIMCWSYGAVLIGVILLLSGYIIHRWRLREAQVVELSQVLKKMFGRYLSTEVMNSLLDNPAALELGGERRRVTIMMTDLRGFTALSERLSPERVVQMLNAYFEVMVDLVLVHRGTINEIIGDALLVVFGAPQDLPDSSRRAIACAIAMQNAMAEVNRRNREQGLPDLEMGIGLNEAEVIVGNIGSTKRSKYAVVGSGVNLAGRIESYAAGGQILISESVRTAAGEVLRLDDRREVRAKGAGAPLVIHQVGGIAGEYNLVLEGVDPEPVALSQSIPVRGVVLKGKHVGSGRFKGLIGRLSAKTALLRPEAELPPLTGIKLNLEQASLELAGQDFYAQVVGPGPPGSGDGTVIIRFSALPPGIDGFFQAAVAYGSTD